MFFLKKGSGGCDAGGWISVVFFKKKGSGGCD